MNLRVLCDKVCEIAVETGEFIRKESENFHIGKARLKGKHDFVSYVDIEAEKKLKTSLSGLLPDAGFIGEEGVANEGKSELKWIVDPLDGTTNFMHGVTIYSISIALARNNEKILGVILDIQSNELFSAYTGGGAWLNGGRIKVSEAETLEDSLIATGFPFKNYEKLGNYMSCLEYFIKNTHGVRRMGSAAIDLAWVACGRFDAFFEYGLNEWDIAAGMVIIREAGGKISDFSGDMDIMDGSETVAANNRLFDKFRADVYRHMKKD